MDDSIYQENKLYVPKKKREAIIEDAHESTSHGGWKVTEARLKNDFFWPNMKEDVKIFTDSCESCLRRKAERAKPSGTMYHHEAFYPLETVAIDAWHTNKASRKNNEIVTTAIDHSTKFMDAQALPQLGSATMYNVKKILKSGSKTSNREREYLVEWSATWKPAASCDCRELINKYEQERKERERMKREFVLTLANQEDDLSRSKRRAAIAARALIKYEFKPSSSDVVAR